MTSNKVVSLRYLELGLIATCQQQSDRPRVPFLMQESGTCTHFISSSARKLPLRSSTMAKKNSRRRRRGKASSSSKPSTNASNFVSDAGPGCFIARRDEQHVKNDWLLEWQDNIDVTEFGCSQDAIPDVALDPQDNSVTFCNIENESKVAYITIYEATVRGRQGQVLENGSCTDSNGRERACVTFIILCPPKTFCHLCYIDVEQSITDVAIDSDVQEWNRHPNPNDEHSLTLGFPLEGGPFLCTQSEGGHLTHFFSGNLHAIDFQCALGTPLLAVANGIVIDVRDNNTLTGIAVSNLFEWNSIQIQVTDADENDPLFVEYVHIATSNVRVGDVVTKGQVIGTSGSVGFSPEPHLHFSAYRSRDATAPTVRVRFESLTDRKVFLPVAGQWYAANGVVDAPTGKDECK